MTQACETLCKTGRCGYGEICVCDHYADWWPKGEPLRPRPRQVRHPGRIYCEGHNAGRIYTCRALWSHLDSEGRHLATAIAGESADD